MKIGLLTFHASHNFGSVMQAWATQKILNEMGYVSEIINFRALSQKDKYAVFPFRSGWKVIARNLAQLKYIKQKHSYYYKYENFINHNLYLSKELNHVSQMRAIGESYDLYVAGSDQIWGYRVPEFVSSKEDIRGIYYLNFTSSPKISYASSTGASALEELSQYRNLLNEFEHISVRESAGKMLLEKILGREVSVVLDPTYLITHDTWCSLANKREALCNEKCILIYTLQGRKKANKWKQLINSLPTAVRTKYDIVTISPFVPIEGHGIRNLAFAGPEEILNLFCNAKFIYTDTFHGMSFAIHFHKQFALFEDAYADERKRNILAQLNLQQRETNDIYQAQHLLDLKIDYQKIIEILKVEAEYSKRYLQGAIKDCLQKIN